MKPRSQRKQLLDRHVDEIRALYASGDYTQTDLAQIYGVSQATVSAIIMKKVRNTLHEYHLKQIIQEFPQYASRIFNFSKKTDKLTITDRASNINYNREAIVTLVELYHLIDQGVLITGKRAAELIGVTHQRVHQYIEEDKFTIVTVGDRGYLYTCEVLAFIEMRKEKKRNISIPKVSNPTQSFPY